MGDREVGERDRRGKRTGGGCGRGRRRKRTRGDGGCGEREDKQTARR